LPKGNIPTYEYDGYVEHTLRISLKDGRYKVEYEPNNFKWYVRPSQYTKGGWSEYTIEKCYPASEKIQGMKAHKKFVINATNTVDGKIKALLKSLSDTMKKPVVSEGDW